MRDDPEAVVLHLVNPAVADRNLQGEDRLARERLALVARERGTHQHKEQI